ncbi:hypothetical protein CQ14_17140 [Bradyrhizobium lablabi]|uniref:Uncharacterized protein n=1 Tax=Bradyrhizobium lablabi TaxID=722472 RepID=A0A0R3MR29_9BRAD|nr:hypothetical protein CQ14_17140 [Bradyrhizobium lablabi]
MPQQTNCRMHHFQLVAARMARATAANKLFFQGDFREDRARERKQAAPVSREAAGECCICFDLRFDVYFHLVV